MTSQPRFQHGSTGNSTARVAMDPARNRASVHPSNKLCQRVRWICLALPLSLLLVIGNVHGADVSYFGIIKSIFYQQTNDVAPPTLVSNAYGFISFVVASSNNLVANATVKPSNTTPLRQLMPDTNQFSWRFEDFTNSQSALDGVYPTTIGLLTPASYTTTMATTNDGVRSVALNFYLVVVPLSYPVTPQLTNLAAARDIDSTRDFQLGWDSLGGSTVAIVQLSIMDSASNLVYLSEEPFETGALTGASFSTVIPADTLPPGANLMGHLSIGNPGLPNTNSYPGAIGVAALGKDTQFPLTTRAAPPPPQLEILPPQAGYLRMRLSGETNRIYQIQDSADLLTWTNNFTTNCLQGVFEYTSPIPFSAGTRFYRGKVGQK